jgi:hypothetical protein
VEHHAVAEPLDDLPAVALGGPRDRRGEARGEVGGCLVALPLGEFREAADVHEADRRGGPHPRSEPGAVQRALDLLDQVLGPRVVLVRVVQGQQGLVRERIELVAPLGGELLLLRFVQPGGQLRQRDLRMPPVRLGLRDPPQGVAVDAEPPVDHGGVESLRELEADQREDLELVLAHRIVRARLREADRFADDEEQLEGDPLPIAHLPERARAHPHEPVVHVPVEEGEGQLPPVHRLGDRLDREPGALEALVHAHAPDVALGEGAVRLRFQHPSVDEALHVPRVDPGSLRDLSPRETQRSVHQLAGPAHAEQRDGIGDALELRVADRLEPEGRVGGCSGDSLADEDLARAGRVRDPGREVDRLPEDIQVALDHRSRVDARV